ncbi:hypothetical protein [Pseudorhodoferax sp.]|uniref:hypothetical protein n=1 Tax=Pseudorhodoferax sp. TaxID=1993553 RepID=UPI0039E6305F
MALLHAAALLLALAIALALRPWRMLAGARLATPLLATLVVLPVLWALPALHPMPLSLRWSGACLVLLMLGWPLAVPALLAVGALAALIGGLPVDAALALAVWQGLVPATLALGLGALVRRLPRNPFVYIFGRGFFGTLLCTFAALLAEYTLVAELPPADVQLPFVALWLMAWADAIVTGMLVAIFVAFRPDWLATWSDRHYLPRP